MESEPWQDSSRLFKGGAGGRRRALGTSFLPRLTCSFISKRTFYLLLQPSGGHCSELCEDPQCPAENPSERGLLCSFVSKNPEGSILLPLTSNSHPRDNAAPLFTCEEGATRNILLKRPSLVPCWTRRRREQNRSSSLCGEGSPRFWSGPPAYTLLSPVCLKLVQLISPYSFQWNFLIVTSSTKDGGNHRSFFFFLRNLVTFWTLVHLGFFLSSDLWWVFF